MAVPAVMAMVMSAVIVIVLGVIIRVVVAIVRVRHGGYSAARVCAELS